MPAEKINIDQFLELTRHHPVIDVRSPGEYNHAHIPGSISLPLFTDIERAAVGTAYKQQSREIAIKIGLDFFGPKMKAMVETVESVVRIPEQQNSKTHMKIKSTILLSALALAASATLAIAQDAVPAAGISGRSGSP